MNVLFLISADDVILMFYLRHLLPICTDKPQFSQSGEYTVDVVEGQPAVVNMTAKANPSEVTYSWSRAGSAVKAAKDASEYDRITFNGPLLNLTTVRRDDKGDYKCEATNAEGTQPITVKLNVQCKQTTILQQQEHQQQH